MRALLVNPWIYDFASYDLWSKPLGLLTIAAYLKRLGCEVDLVDCLDRFHPSVQARNTPFGDGRYHSEEIEKPAIFRKIPRRFKRYGIPKAAFEETIAAKEDYDIILVTAAMTYWYGAYIDIIRILKKRFGTTPVVLGGNYANLCFEHAKRYSGADIVHKGRDMGGILDIIDRTAGAGFDHSLISDTRRLFPAYEMYKKFGYVTLRTSEGCPFRCTYCGWYLVEEKFRRQDPDFVISEIEYFHKNFGVRNFSFYDDALLYDADNHIVKILDALAEKKVDVLFHTPNGLHNRFMTLRLAKLLKRSNFIRPRLALETSSAGRQIATGSKTTNEEFLCAVRYLKEAGYGPSDISVYILIGLPGQSISEVRQSAEFASATGARIYLEEYSPIPGTPDYERSGLAADADPLLHNNSAFPLYNPDEYRKIQELKTFVHELNGAI